MLTKTHSSNLYSKPDEKNIEQPPPKKKSALWFFWGGLDYPLIPQNGFPGVLGPKAMVFGGIRALFHSNLVFSEAK